MTLAWSLLPNGASAYNEDAGIAAAVALAAASDVAVIVVGESDGVATNGLQTVGEGVDVNHLNLPGRQEELVLAVAATGVPVVVVLLHGRPLSIPNVAAAVPAIVSAWFPGQAGGERVRGGMRAPTPSRIAAARGGRTVPYRTAPHRDVAPAIAAPPRRHRHRRRADGRLQPSGPHAHDVAARRRSAAVLLRLVSRGARGGTEGACSHSIPAAGSRHPRVAPHPPPLQ